jgi:YhfZ-like protein/helix-turn-helix protein
MSELRTPDARTSAHDGNSTLLASALLTKSAAVAKAIAIDVMSAGSGDRLPSISDYTKRLHVGTGTVQGALAHLQAHGAVSLEPRGRLGTLIRDRDLAGLWYVAFGRPVLGCLPMPYSRVFDALATALVEALRQAGLRLAFLHVDGSAERTALLLNGEADFVVLSSLAARLASEEGAPLAIAARFGRGSFIHRHVIVTRRNESSATRDGMIVGIDRTSLDHSYITRLVCKGARVKYRDVRYLDFGRRLLDGEIDLVVWHSDDVINLHSSELRQRRLPAGVLRHLNGDNTEAAVVTRDHDGPINTILAETISPQAVRSTEAHFLRVAPR